MSQARQPFPRMGTRRPKEVALDSLGASYRELQRLRCSVRLRTNADAPDWPAYYEAEKAFDRLCAHVLGAYVPK